MCLLQLAHVHTEQKKILFQILKMCTEIKLTTLLIPAKFHHSQLSQTVHEQACSSQIHEYSTELKTQASNCRLVVGTWTAQGHSKLNITLSKPS